MLLASLPGVLWSLALFALTRALRAFAKGDLFGPSVNRALRGFALWALASAALGLVSPTLLVLVWSLAQGPGETTWIIHINPGHLSTILLASVMWLFSKIIERARLLADENSSFV